MPSRDSGSGGIRTLSISRSKREWSSSCLPSHDLQDGTHAQGGSRTHTHPGLSRVARPVGVPGRSNKRASGSRGTRTHKRRSRHLFSRQAPHPAGWLPSSLRYRTQFRGLESNQRPPRSECGVTTNSNCPGVFVSPNFQRMCGVPSIPGALRGPSNDKARCLRHRAFGLREGMTMARTSTELGIERTGTRRITGGLTRIQNLPQTLAVHRRLDTSPSSRPSSRRTQERRRSRPGCSRPTLRFSELRIHSAHGSRSSGIL